MNRLILAACVVAASTSVFAGTSPATVTDNTTNVSSSSTTLPAAPNAQQDQTPQNSQTTTTVQQTTVTTTTAAVPAVYLSAPRPEKPIFSTAVGATYVKSDLSGVGGSLGTHFWGFYGAPMYRATRWMGIRTDFEQDYAAESQYSALHLLRITGGPEFNFPIPYVKKWTTPFVYVEGGGTRISLPGILEWDATFDGGIGVNLPITRAVSFQVIPGEYSAINTPGGNTRFSSQYSAKAGFVLNFYGRQ